MKKTTKPKSTLEALEKRVERFDLLTSPSQASVGLTFEQLARGDTHGLREDLRRKMTGRVRNGALSMKVDSISHRHQVVYVQAYSKPACALLDSGALPNVMFSAMANALNITLKPTNRSIRVASGAAEPCSGIAENVPIRFGGITVHLDFLVIDGAP